jgi:hypothetical protein
MPNKKNRSSSQFISTFQKPNALNQETINLQKNIEKNTARLEDKFQKWVEAIHADGSLKTVDSITKAMLRMSADELHNVYNFNATNDKNTEIDGLSEYFKTNHSGIAPNKMFIMILVLSCVLATANCNSIPLSEDNQSKADISQAYDDYLTNNFIAQNLHNSTYTGKQNNITIVCGTDTANNTNHFNKYRKLKVYGGKC